MKAPWSTATSKRVRWLWCYLPDLLCGPYRKACWFHATVSSRQLQAESLHVARYDGPTEQGRPRVSFCGVRRAVEVRGSCHPPLQGSRVLKR